MVYTSWSHVTIVMCRLSHWTSVTGHPWSWAKAKSIDLNVFLKMLRRMMKSHVSTCIQRDSPVNLLAASLQQAFHVTDNRQTESAKIIFIESIISNSAIGLGLDWLNLCKGSAGKNKGAADKRAGTLEPILQYLEDKTPTTFVLENVAGLTSKKHRHWVHLFLMLASLSDLRFYHCHVAPINLN